MSGVRCCERAWGLPQRTSISCRPRALTRRSVAVRPAAEKNTYTPARIVCGRRVFCYRRLSLYNGKLVIAAPLPGRRKPARRLGQNGGDDLPPIRAINSICAQPPKPGTHGQAPASRRLTATQVAASTSPALERQNQRPWAAGRTYPFRGCRTLSPRLKCRP